MEFFELFVAQMRLSGADIEPFFRAEVIEKVFFFMVVLFQSWYLNSLIELVDLQLQRLHLHYTFP